VRRGGAWPAGGGGAVALPARRRGGGRVAGARRRGRRRGAAGGGGGGGGGHRLRALRPALAVEVEAPAAQLRRADSLGAGTAHHQQLPPARTTSRAPLHECTHSLHAHLETSRRISVTAAVLIMCALLRRRGWQMAGTANHSGSRLVGLCRRAAAPAAWRHVRLWPARGSLQVCKFANMFARDSTPKTNTRGWSAVATAHIFHDRNKGSD
jgi:hypothetical protein